MGNPTCLCSPQTTVPIILPSTRHYLSQVCHDDVPVRMAIFERNPAQEAAFKRCRREYIAEVDIAYKVSTVPEGRCSTLPLAQCSAVLPAVQPNGWFVGELQQRLLLGVLLQHPQNNSIFLCPTCSLDPFQAGRIDEAVARARNAAQMLRNSGERRASRQADAK